MTRIEKVRCWTWWQGVRRLAGLGALSGLVALQVVAADKVLFEDDFETGRIVDGRSPVWSWGMAYTPTRAASHMMYGEGDIYEVSDEQAHSGRYALRLNFSGRNDFCNVCGTRVFELQGVGTAAPHLTGNGGEIYQPSQAGSLRDERVLYNRNDYFAKWTWRELRSAMQGGPGSPVSNAMGGRGRLNNGDTLLLANQCGIDGTVGRNGDRRSDCDRAINYLEGVSAAYFPYGGVLSRRFYIYIPEEATIPENTLKLGYIHFKRPNDLGEYKQASGVVVISVQRKLQLEAVLRDMGEVGYMFSGLNLERNAWYYIEEAWQRESAEKNDDGKYWLYAGKSGEDVSKPLIQKEGIRYGELLRVSIHGNWQHWDAVSGHIYFDDVKIARERSGPAKGSSGVMKSPNIRSAFQKH